MHLPPPNRHFLLFLITLFTFPLHAETTLGNGKVLADKPYFVVTYFDAEPDSADIVANLLREQSQSSRQEAGNLRFEALQQIHSPNHFVILESWTDASAHQAHNTAEHTKTFQKALAPLLFSPYDEREHAGLDLSSEEDSAGNASSTYVVSHLDIIPPEQFSPCDRQIDANGPCGNQLIQTLAEKSREHPGNQRFDVLTMADRPNHMTVIEVWSSEDTQAAHTVTEDVKRFRSGIYGVEINNMVPTEPVNPLIGSLYDERLFHLLD